MTDIRTVLKPGSFVEVDNINTELDLKKTKSIKSEFFLPPPCDTIPFPLPVITINSKGEPNAAVTMYGSGNQETFDHFIDELPRRLIDKIRGKKVKVEKSNLVDKDAVFPPKEKKEKKVEKKDEEEKKDGEDGGEKPKAG